MKNIKWFTASFACLFMAFGHANAATAEEEARMTRCPDGQYAGPGTAARRFMQDPYVWFVSREFAKRFCMPESYIDDSLKGALAIAVRIKPNEEVTCGMYMGRSDQCPVKNQLLLDIYVDNRKANIPKADPTVEFYSGRVFNSGWVMGVSGVRADRRRKGEITEVPGERRPFTPFEKDDVERTLFHYIGVRNGWASESGEFIEAYYRANWIEGIDLITLNAYNFGYKSLLDPDNPIHKPGAERNYPDAKLDKTNPIRRWAIGVILGKDFYKPQDRSNGTVYPGGYLHTIELPHKVAQMIYAFDHQEGEKFFNAIERAIKPEPTSAPSQTR